MHRTARTPFSRSLSIAALAAVALALALAPVARAAPIDIDNPPQGRFIDDWLEIFMAGGKVGYGHTTMTRDGDVIETKTEFTMKMGRASAPVEISVSQSTRETVAGKVLGFGSTLDASVMQTEQKGTVADGKVKIISSQMGMEQRREFDFPDGALMTWGTFREQVRRGLQPGTSYEFDVYSPDLRMDGAVRSTVTVIDWETFEHDGRQKRGLRVDSTIAGPMGEMTLKTWVDKDGNLLRGTMPMPGIGDFVMVVSNQESAMADFVPRELFMTTTIKAKQPIDFKNAQSITYHMKPREGMTAEDIDLTDLLSAAGQRVEIKDDGSAIINVSRQDRTLAGKVDLPKEMQGEYLGSNLSLNTDDPEVVKLAQGVKPDPNNAYVTADRLRRFVSDYIDAKNMNIGFATASEVCRNKEGDCSEHGVLLAALGRVHGLPSRVAAGLAYVPLFGNQDDIFGYHMWTQFYIDGRWVDYDAAIPESDCSPIRIALAASSLQDAGMADLSFPLLSKIGAIDLDILNIEPKPLKTPAD